MAHCAATWGVLAELLASAAPGAAVCCWGACGSSSASSRSSWLCIASSLATKQLSPGLAPPCNATQGPVGRQRLQQKSWRGRGFCCHTGNMQRLAPAGSHNGRKRLRRTCSGAAALGSHMESRSGLSSLQAARQTQGSLVQHNAVHEGSRHRPTWLKQCALWQPRAAPAHPTCTSLQAPVCAVCAVCAVCLPPRLTAPTSSHLSGSTRRMWM